MTQPYQALLELPHHVSKRHPPMPREKRAAQFAPFAALTGYEEMLEARAQSVEAPRELSDHEHARLDALLQKLIAHLPEHPAVTITHFVPDATKCGGRYLRTSGHLARVSPETRRLTLAEGLSIPFTEIIEMDSAVFQALRQPPF